MATVKFVVPLLALVLLGPGCDKRSSGGGNINVSSGTLSINAPSDVIKCGACQPFTATYTKGGVTQTVTPTWSTDYPEIATIDASGQFTPLANGDVTVTARYEDATTTKQIHVVNDYGTMWAGQYVITRCEASAGAAWEGFCDVFEAGAALPIGLEFQQERYAVSGTVWLGAVQTAFTGSVGSGGELTGESKGSIPTDDGVAIDVLVSAFRAIREADRIPDGSFTATFTISAYSGRALFDARLMGLDKYTGGRTSARKAPRPPRTLRDVWQMMRER